MKSLKLLFTGLILAGGAAAFDGASSAYAAERPAALYSFADVYRLTVAGPNWGFANENSDAALRVAVAQPPLGAELRFLVSAVPQPDKWLLLLAGLALAGWVAHRRLIHSL